MSEYRYPVSGPIDIVAKFGFGAITVEAVDDLTEAQLTITAREPESDVLANTTAELRGNTLVINGPRPRGNNLFELPVFGGNGNKDALDVVVRVPSGSRVKVATFAADITTHGRTGNADVASGSSTIALDAVDGDARIRFGSGPVRIASVRGSASVRAGSSDVEVGYAGGDVDIRFGAGSLEIGDAQGSVRMKTGAGSARIASAGGDVDLTSGTGEIAIGIPAGRQARLDVLSGTGRVNTEMPIEQAPSATAGRPIRIKAVTGSGDVTISRASAPVAPVSEAS